MLLLDTVLEGSSSSILYTHRGVTLIDKRWIYVVKKRLIFAIITFLYKCLIESLCFILISFQGDELTLFTLTD